MHSSTGHNCAHLLASVLQDWLQMQAKADEAAMRREYNQTTRDMNKHLEDERKLKELQDRVS